MGFKERYEKNLGNDTTSISSVLPFFGFSYKHETQTDYFLHDEGYSATSDGRGGLDIRKRPDSLRSSETKWCILERKCVPSGGKRDLENQFCNAYPKATQDPFHTPRLYASEEDFYNACGADMLFESSFMKKLSLTM